MKESIRWLGSPESRILSIRNFRKYIERLPFDQAVMLTRENWQSSPASQRYDLKLPTTMLQSSPSTSLAITSSAKASAGNPKTYTPIFKEHGIGISREEVEGAAIIEGGEDR